MRQQFIKLCLPDLPTVMLVSPGSTSAIASAMHGAIFSDVFCSEAAYWGVQGTDRNESEDGTFDLHQPVNHCHCSLCDSALLTA